MLLITMQEWLGPGRRYPRNLLPPPPIPTIRTVAFSTSLPLGKALSRLKEYQEAFNERYTLAVNLTLLSVQTIETIERDLLEYFQVESIALLARTPADFDK